MTISRNAWLAALGFHVAHLSKPSLPSAPVSTVMDSLTPMKLRFKIVEFFYDPDPVTVQVGGKVIWQNEDTIPHTATAKDGSFDTGTIEPGKLKSETFKQAGSYRYVCEIHPRMSGTVEVVEKDLS